MAENEDATPGPVEPTPVDETAQQPAATEAAPAAAPTGPKFTDRLWNFRAMVAVALAALLLGGGLGAAVTALSHDDRPDHGPGMMRWRDGGPGMMAPGFGPGQRQQLRQDLKKMRRDMRERRQQGSQDAPDAPAPNTPSATPTPSPGN